MAELGSIRKRRRSRRRGGSALPRWIRRGLEEHFLASPGPEETGRPPRVIIVGAGVSGLSAAKALAEANIDVLVLEGRGRIGGRVHTIHLPETNAPVDLGASYMHGCTSDHSIYKIALERRIRCDASNSGSTYEAAWYDHRSGKRIRASMVQRAHRVMYSAARRLTEVAVAMRDKGDADVPLSQVFEDAVRFVLNRRGCRLRRLSQLEQVILRCAAKRAWQICADFGLLSTIAEASWADEEEEEERAEQSQAAAPGQMEGEKGVREAREKTEYPTDRLVVGGYTPFLVQHLARDVRVVTHTVVKRVQSREGGRCEVVTADGSAYACDCVLMTLPVGVLKSRSRVSSVEFDPPLSQDKRDAIETFGMGSENKIVLRFRDADVFWPPRINYLMSTDIRFRFINLHSYGHRGVLVAHGQPPFSWNWGGLSDEELVEQTLRTLAAMFGLERAPPPVFTYVTRWDSDPFSMGSYSYFGVGSDSSTVDALCSREGVEGDERVFFAGEACSVEGHQCVHGAHETGVRAAWAIAAKLRGEVGDDDYGLPVKKITWAMCSMCEEWREVAATPKVLSAISEQEDWECGRCGGKQEQTKGSLLPGEGMPQEDEKLA